MSETVFRKWLIDNIKKACAEDNIDVHVTRIESYTIKGIPDINLCASRENPEADAEIADVITNFGETWIEAKYEKGNLTGISGEQRNWINARTKAGGMVWIAVKRKTAKLDQIEFHLGNRVDELYNKEQPTPIMCLTKKGNTYSDNNNTLKQCLLNIVTWRN